MRLKTTLILSLILLVGCVSTPAPTATPIPTETPTLVASSTPTSEPTMTPVPPTATPEVTPETIANATPTLIPVTLQPVIELDLPAPIHIDLPEGWKVGTGGLPMQEGFGVGMIPFTVYIGPVTGGQGYITLLWGFPNVTPGTLLPGQQVQIDLWSDGIRLLYLAILESGCSIGRDEARTFKVGGRDARGSYFAAQDCPELFDTRGWFAALQESELNFAFYVYTDPVEAMDGPAQAELQTILDSVVFDMSLLPTPEGTEETGQ